MFNHSHCRTGARFVIPKFRGPEVPGRDDYAMTSWRLWPCAVGVVALVAAVCCSASANPLPVRVSPNASLKERLESAKALLADSPLIDGHNDLPWNVRKFLHNKLHSFNLADDLRNEKPWRKSNFSHTDIPRLRKGHVSAQFWSAYVPCESQFLNTVQLLLEQIDVIKRMLAAHTNVTTIVTTPAGIMEEFRRGRIASLMGVEGGHALGSSMGVVRALYDLGVRYITLTHKCHTPWAECSEINSTSPPANAKGLTPYGEVMIQELNRIGMIIDVSHTSRRTAKDVLRISKAPILLSHSAVRKYCDIERNVPDDILNKIVENRGIVMISFFNNFLTCTDNATLKDVVKHINHVRSMAGVDHVGIGAGYDGINRTPLDLEDVSKYPYLFAELLTDPTWSLQDLKKLAGLNFIRVFTEVEEIKHQMLNEKPSEEIIPIHDIDAHWHCRYKFASLDHDMS